MKTGVELIAQERTEQIEKHGRTIQYDVDFNKWGQFQDAAIMIMQTDRRKMNPPSFWDKTLWKRMIEKPEKERLIIAGALIAAEIDRMQYSENDKDVPDPQSSLQEHLHPTLPEMHQAILTIENGILYSHYTIFLSDKENQELMKLLYKWKEAFLDVKKQIAERFKSYRKE